jgi:hypothetical protein
MLERFFLYSKAFSIAAAKINYDQRIEIRQNADFYLRAIAMYNSTGAIAGRMKRADGSYFTGNDFLHLSGFMNTAGFARPTPLYPQIRYPQSSAFVFDLQDLGGAGDPTIYPLLIGTERYADGALPPAAYPAKYIEEDYTITKTVSITGLDKSTLDLPIACNTGDPFVIRTFSWRFDDTLTEPFTMAFRMRDEYGRAFMNDWVPLRLLFSGPTEAAAPYLSSPFPELVIPANGAFSIDLWNRTEAGPFTVELSFGGVRLVEVGT